METSYSPGKKEAFRSSESHEFSPTSSLPTTTSTHQDESIKKPSTGFTNQSLEDQPFSSVKGSEGGSHASSQFSLTLAEQFLSLVRLIFFISKFRVTLFSSFNILNVSI